MNDDVQSIWVYLATSPLLALTLTLIAYQVGQWLYLKSGRHALVNPVLIAVCLVIAFLFATGTSYATYFEGAQFVHFLLGPATVALAIPLYQQMHLIKESLLAIVVAVFCGSCHWRPSPQRRRWPWEFPNSWAASRA